jgi:Ca2+-binding RTX toxin-like protein
MKSFIPLKNSPVIRAAALMLALGAALAFVTAIAARPADAAPVQLRDGVLSVTGTNGADEIALRLRVAHPGILQIDLGDDGSADFSVRRRRVERIVVNAAGQDDLIRIDDRNGPFTDGISTSLRGGGGNDKIIGGKGGERLSGGDGNDAVDGNGGRDIAALGAGDDIFVWNAGDGSDIVEGGTGADRMQFNGASSAEQIELSARKGRLRLSRDLSGVVMDADGVEQIDLNALGGADLVTVDDLAGTGVSVVRADLAGSLKGAPPDELVDRLVINGTSGDDAITVTGDPGEMKVIGLAEAVAILNQEPTDELFVKGLGGSDTIDAATLAADAITANLNGGAGGDLIAGGPGSEVLNGAAGNDRLDGNGGGDLAALGDGDDVFVWDPGDGSDIVEGQNGADTMRFNGAPLDEEIELSANTGRLKLVRDVGGVTMDTAGVEQIDVDTLEGADAVFVNSLVGTGVSGVDVDLAGALGGSQSDRVADHVVVNGTDDVDTIDISRDSSVVKVSGLASTIRISNADATLDELRVNDQAGDDVVHILGDVSTAIRLFVDGIHIP